MEKIELTVEAQETPVRADRYIAEHTDISRSRLKGECTLCINGKEAKLSKNVSEGDVITLELAPLKGPEDIEPQKMDLDIIYEDDNVIVINKEQGMVVHPAAGNFQGTLVNGLLDYVTGLDEEFDDDTVRPGIVHRLDKDTSGVIIIAKNPQTHEFLSRQFRDKVTRKTYIAIVRGRLPKKHDIIDTYIVRDRQNRKKFTVPSDPKGKQAITEYQVEKEFGSYTLCRLFPHTGRTHQLRVHMQHLNAPILGDPVYSRADSRFPDATLMLHAASLEIFIPGVETKMMFCAPMPDRFEKVLEALSVGEAE